MKTFNQVIHECLYQSCSTEWLENLEDKTLTLASADLPRAKADLEKVLPVFIPTARKNTDLSKFRQEPAFIFPTDSNGLELVESKDDWCSDIAALKNRLFAMHRGWEDQADLKNTPTKNPGTNISRRENNYQEFNGNQVPSNIALPESVLFGSFHILKLVQKGINDVDIKARLMKSLNSLSLTGNDIASVNQKHLPKNLRSLYLDGNKLIDIPDISDLPLLQHLGLSFNQISFTNGIPDCCSKMMIVSLDLSYNSITDIESVCSAVSLLPKLSLLWLAGNPLSLSKYYRGVVLKMVPQLKYLDGLAVNKSIALPEKLNYKDASIRFEISRIISVAEPALILQTDGGLNSKYGPDGALINPPDEISYSIIPQSDIFLVEDVSEIPLINVEDTQPSNFRQSKTFKFTLSTKTRDQLLDPVTFNLVRIKHVFFEKTDDSGDGTDGQGDSRKKNAAKSNPKSDKKGTKTTVKDFNLEDYNKVCHEYLKVCEWKVDFRDTLMKGLDYMAKSFEVMKSNEFMEYEKGLVMALKEKEPVPESTSVAPPESVVAAKLAAPAKGNAKKDAVRGSVIPVELPSDIAARKADNPVAAVIDWGWYFEEN